MEQIEKSLCKEEMFSNKLLPLLRKFLKKDKEKLKNKIAYLMNEHAEFTNWRLLLFGDSASKIHNCWYSFIYKFSFGYIYIWIMCSSLLTPSFTTWENGKKRRAKAEIRDRDKRWALNI